MRVVALYMAPDSVMFELLADENVWTEARDARLYRGEWPVVAAPPCAGYSRLKHLTSPDSGRDSCAPIALEQVRSYGGVLEHPKHSRLWNEFGLPAAGGFDRDKFGGWTLEVNQFDFGHPALKPTWLYIVGVPPCEVWAMLPPRRPGRARLIFFRPSAKNKIVGKKMPNGMRYRAGMFLENAEAKKWRTAYPRAFAETLLAIAAKAR